MTPRRSKISPPDYITLGPRQAEIYRLILIAAYDGRDISDQEIADELGITKATVKTLVRRIFDKFGVRSKRELVYGQLRAVK